MRKLRQPMVNGWITYDIVTLRVTCIDKRSEVMERSLPQALLLALSASFAISSLFVVFVHVL